MSAGEDWLARLADHVACNPGDSEARRKLAAVYENRGFIEEAVAQHCALLACKPRDRDSRAALDRLTAKEMPRWLAPEAAGIAFFQAEVLELRLADPGAAGKSIRRRLLYTRGSYLARVGERRDQARSWRFDFIDYGYVWSQPRNRWEMRARVHWAGRTDRELARCALQAVLTAYVVAREYVCCDPTETWRRPVDIWVTPLGKPGAETIGTDIYLYACRVSRPSAEWLRELVHEYGHTCLPGLGGFTDTDDPWADGHMMELLFPKWLLAEEGPAWLAWSAPEMEAAARVRRAELLAGAAGRPDKMKLKARDVEARDHFLGLALWVEEELGPRFLGEVLQRCRRGSATQFVIEAERLAKERGEGVWPEEGEQ